VATVYDLVVIGGGAAGLGATRVEAAASAHTLLVSEGEIGGECTFTGSVPSRTLIEAAARGARFPDAIAAVRKAVAAIAATEIAEVLAREGIEVLRGRAVFTSPRKARDRALLPAALSHRKPGRPPGLVRGCRGAAPFDLKISWSAVSGRRCRVGTPMTNARQDGRLAGMPPRFWRAILGSGDQHEPRR